MPARPSLVLALAIVVYTASSYVLDPVSVGVVGLPLPALAGRFVLESFNGSIFILLAYQLIRQLRHVSRTLARSAVIDLFQPGPIYAFSKLTSRTGIALVALSASSLLATPIPTDSRVFLLYWAPFLSIPPLIAAIAFVVPLYGMHGRLVPRRSDSRARPRSGSRACCERSTAMRMRVSWRAPTA